ncbi:MAG: hypothetical protein PVI40_04905 [Chlamydiota bacterium]|jgi:hypothetical protein
MKKWLLMIVAIISCSAIYANQPERVETLSAKIIKKNKEGYFVLADGSYWKAIGFSKRWRSLSEWWNNVELAPEQYDCVPDDWYLGSLIEVYPKYGNLEISEADASNQEIIKQCTNLLVNNRTGQVLFAIELSPEECLVRLFEEARNEGYDEGYIEGTKKNYKNSAESYNRGHAEGYRVGYTEGYQAAINENLPRNDLVN